MTAQEKRKKEKMCSTSDVFARRRKRVLSIHVCVLLLSATPYNRHRRGARGTGIASRMFSTPVANWTSRSNPKPHPACGTEPNRRKSRYHCKSDDSTSPMPAAGASLSPLPSRSKPSSCMMRCNTSKRSSRALPPISSPCDNNSHSSRCGPPKRKTTKKTNEYEPSEGREGQNKPQSRHHRCVACRTVCNQQGSP